jgi:putative transposase
MSINNENFGAESAEADSDDSRWLEACRREEAVRKLLSRSQGTRLKMADVRGVALELGVSQATLYRLIVAYRRAPTVEALEPKRRGRPKGMLVLDKLRDHLIRQTIREVYLKPQRPTLAHLVEQVHLRFAQQSWQLPDRRTIKLRVDEIEKRLTARRRQDASAIKATTPVPGQYNASRPLDVLVRSLGSAH